jgi:hypothetical protein
MGQELNLALVKNEIRKHVDPLIMKLRENIYGSGTSFNTHISRTVLPPTVVHTDSIEEVVTAAGFIKGIKTYLTSVLKGSTQTELNFTGNGVSNVTAAGDRTTVTISGIIQARVGSGTTYSRQRINFIETDNVTITITDDPAESEMEVGISVADSGMQNPMTAIGDIIYGKAASITNQATAGQGASATAIATTAGSPSNVIDEDLGTSWHYNKGSSMVGDWVQVDLGSAKAIVGFRLRQGFGSFRMPAGYKIQSSNDASSWIDNYSIITGANVNDSGVLALSAESTARYWRIIITVSLATEWEIQSLDFYSGTLDGFPERRAIGSTGEVLTVSGGLPYWKPSSVGARVYNPADITISGEILTKLPFNLERYDTDTIHSTTSDVSRLTCKTAGLYVVMGQATWQNEGTGERYLDILLNNTTILSKVTQPPTSVLNTSMVVTTMWNFSIGDYVELRAYQTTVSSGTLNIIASGNYTPEFMMQKA